MTFVTRSMTEIAKTPEDKRLILTADKRNNGLASLALQGRYFYMHINILGAG